VKAKTDAATTAPLGESDEARVAGAKLLADPLRRMAATRS
jgi:hypothetical protein